MTQNNLYMENDEMKLYVDVQPLLLDEIESSRNAAIASAASAAQSETNARNLKNSIADYKTSMEIFYAQASDGLTNLYNNSISELSLAKHNTLNTIENSKRSVLNDISTNGQNYISQVQNIVDNRVSIEHLNSSKCLSGGEEFTDADAVAEITNYAHSTFDRSKFTAAGSFVIPNDGIASNFTSSNFIKVPKEILNNVRTNSWSIKVRGQLNNYASAPKQLFSAGGVWDDVNTFLNVGHLNNTYNWFNVVTVDNSGTKERVPLLDTSTNNGFNVVPDTNIGNWFSYELNFNATTHTYSSRLAFDSGSVFTSSVTNNNYLAQQTNDLYIGYNYGDYSIDLKQFSITIDGVEVFSGNKTGIDTIKPDAYTTTTTPPTISNDGIASNFTSSNFIKVPKEILNNVGINSWSIEVEGVCNNYGAFAPVFSGSGHVWNDTASFFNVGRLSTANTWISYIILDNNGTKENTHIGSSDTLQASVIGQAYRQIIGYDSFAKKYYSNIEFADGTKADREINSNLYLAQQTDDLYIGYNYGDYSINLNTLKIYVAGNLVFQGCLKIPYTLSKTGSKVVDSIYYERVKDLSEQGYIQKYYVLDEDNGKARLPIGDIYGMIENLRKLIMERTTE